MSVQQLLMSYGAATRLLDNLSLTNLFTAVALTKLRTAYAGSCIRVRRSSDNTEQDIGFTGTALDTASLATFVGANSAFVTKMYDQSGNGNDFAQATTTKQPRIVNSGTYDGKAVFDGTDDYLATAASSTASTAITTFINGNLRSTTGTKIIYEMAQGIPTVGKNLLQHYITGGNSKVATSSGANNTEAVFSQLLTNNVHSARADRSLNTVAGQDKLYVGGTQASNTGTITNGGIPTGSYTAETWEIGSRSTDSSLSAQLDLKAFIVFTEDRTDLSAIANRVIAET